MQWNPSTLKKEQVTSEEMARERKEKSVDPWTALATASFLLLPRCFPWDHHSTRALSLFLLYAPNWCMQDSRLIT